MKKNLENYCHYKVQADINSMTYEIDLIFLHFLKLKLLL